MLERSSTMDKAKDMKAILAASTAVITCLLVVLILIGCIGITNTVIHGIFAFNNPDKNAGKEDCYAIFGKPEPLTYAEVQEGGLMLAYNVTWHWNLYSTLCFSFWCPAMVGVVCSIINAINGIVNRNTENPAHGAAMGCASCLSFCCMFFPMIGAQWITIYGAVMRWSQIGQTCSGTYNIPGSDVGNNIQLSTAKYINAEIIFSIIGIFCLPAIVFCTVCCTMLCCQAGFAQRIERMNNKA